MVGDAVVVAKAGIALGFDSKLFLESAGNDVVSRLRTLCIMESGEQDRADFKLRARPYCSR